MDWVFAVERAYVAAAMGSRPSGDSDLSRARAAAGAVASRFLAVGTPRSFALIGEDGAAMSLEAHRTWFQPRDLRCTSEAVSRAIGGRVVPIAEALAADIVCIHQPLALAAAQLRRGTHINVLAEVTLDDELRALATICDEARDLPALAAGLVDGRKLDELTVFIAGDAAIARIALGR